MLSREEESGIIYVLCGRGRRVALHMFRVVAGGEWHYICSVLSREESGIIYLMCGRGRRVALYMFRVVAGGEWHYICYVWSREKSGIIYVMCGRGRRRVALYMFRVVAGGGEWHYICSVSREESGTDKEHRRKVGVDGRFTDKTHQDRQTPAKVNGVFSTQARTKVFNAHNENKPITCMSARENLVKIIRIDLLFDSQII